MPKIYIIAGEASGDNIGAKLMREILKLNPEAEFYGIGGEKMEKVGLNLLFPAKELSIMGFLEIIPALPRIWLRLRKTIANIIDIQPDIIITIDAPGFNFRVTKAIKNKVTAKLIHYVAPTVWAYKPERAKEIAKIYDRLLVILPFEPEYFTEEGLATDFVGYPALEDLNFSSKEYFRIKLNIPKGNLLLCLAPGSRRQEVKTLLPIFLKAINILEQKLKRNITIAIPCQNNLLSLVKKYTKQATNIILVADEDKQNLFSSADLALTKSGTITTELGFFGIPMVVAHKINWLSYFLIKRVLKVKYASIINLIAEQEIIPELIQGNCKSTLIAEELERLTDLKQRQQQLNGINSSLDQLGINSSPSKIAAEKILQELN
jgi:lipid-A-disaccharide synthase